MFRPYRYKTFLALAGLSALALLTGCARIPALDQSISAEVEQADYPALLPEDALPPRSLPAGDGDSVAEALNARAAALRARAAALMQLSP